MASFSEKVKWSKEPTYADVRGLYEQVKEISAQMNCVGFDPFFHFTCGSMRCTTHSVEEFIEAAYGADDFSLVAMQLIIFLDGGNTVSAGYLGGLSISGSNKMLLEDFKNRLHLDVFGDNREKQVTVMNNKNTHGASKTKNGQSAVNSPITINGSGNIINIAGDTISDNKTENKVNPENSKSNSSGIKGFSSGVFQGVVGNAVWALLGVAAAAILAYLANS